MFYFNYLNISFFYKKTSIEISSTLMVILYKNTWKDSHKQLIVTGIINVLHFFNQSKPNHSK